MNRLHLYILCFLLTLIGGGIFYYKAFVLHFPLSPDVRSSVWTVEAHLAFDARNKAVKVTLNIPKNSSRFLIVDESFVSRGFGLTTQALDDNRQAQWSVRKSIGQQGLYYRANVRRAPTQAELPKFKKPEFQPSGFMGAELAAAKALIAEIKQHSADVPSFAAALVKRLNENRQQGDEAVLLGKKPSKQKKAEVAVAVLAEDGISARIAHGVELSVIGRNAPFDLRLEVYDEGRWHSFDPVTASTEVPEDFLVWWRGSVPLSTLEGGERLKTTVSVQRFEEEGLEAAVSGTELTQPLLMQFSLFSLPLEAQSVYRIILLIPIGAFLVVIMRNLIGFKAFGTFMPILVALAFREAELLWGLSFFVLIVGLGLVVRLYLDHLKLLLVPRLASVLTVVVLLMACISVLAHHLGLERGISVALFPMVIMTMTIERMSIVWDELGAAASIRQGLGTLLAAALIYAAITFEPLAHIVFVFPETILILLAVTLLLGRYSGYRLLELKRFRELTKEWPDA